ncbi:MAG TPA: DNA polymerase/3'-5' exonuclease PolX [Candidatus Manganitrophaceae bacterium]|nr:DNA polymerase/3'-5' exonuclease PolX [Candidatus Manganitrophaceae bacterium]
MNKEEIIRILEESAVLLELKGESPFKCQAYINAARALALFENDLTEGVRSRSLLERQGIGKAMFEKISEWVTTGRLNSYEELKRSTPSGLLEMLKIKGLGPKKVRMIYEKLGISDLGELDYACVENRLIDLPGFGEKTQDKIREGISFYKRQQNWRHCHVASREGAALLGKLREKKGVIRASLAGSLRRRNEVVQDIDVVVSCHDAAALIQHIHSFQEIERVMETNQHKTRLLLKSGIAADIYVTSDDLFPYLLHYYTGGKAYLEALSERARRFGIKISEYGLFLDDHILPCQDEREIFSTLEMEYIEPELRENRGEIEAASRRALPTLVEEKDLKGVFHVHSAYSDGSASLAEMVEATERLGYQYIGISDHSESAFYANGLKEDRIKKQHEEIDALRERFKKIHIFKGIEADILPDGRLDYNDRILSSFDFVIASVHSKFNMSEEEMTERVTRAMRHPAVTFLGHPTGRLLLSRSGYPLSIPKVIETARRRDVILEINASPYRLDLDWRYCKLAKEAGVRFSVNPDAHQVEGLSDTSFGVGIARKGWLSPGDLINTLPVSEIQSYLKKKKNRS